MLTLSAHTEQGGDMEVVLGLMVILQGVSHGKLFGFFLKSHFNHNNMLYISNT